MTSPEITDAAGPRPWTVETNLPYGEQPRIYDANGRLVAVVGNVEIDRQDEWEGNAELIVATVNALAAGVAPGVKVKALVWNEGDWYAVSQINSLHYTVGRYGGLWFFMSRASGLVKKFESVEAAKAAAQADYEARILSALEPARPALVAEPAPVVVQPLTAAPARADVTALREALERATASLRRAVDLAAAMLTNDPNEPVSDAGHVLLDVWKDELERLRSQLAALAQSAAPVAPEDPYWKGAYERMADRNVVLSEAVKSAILVLDDLATGQGIGIPIEQIIRDLNAVAHTGGAPASPDDPYDRGRRDILNALLAPNPAIAAKIAKWAEPPRDPDPEGRLPFDVALWITEVAEQLGIKRKSRGLQKPAGVEFDWSSGRYRRVALTLSGDEHD